MDKDMDKDMDKGEEDGEGVTLVEIYEAYPRKVGRAKAIEAIGKAVSRLEARGNGSPGRWLLLKVQEYAASPRGQAPGGGEPDYRPYPATWFNQDRFDDDPSEWGVKSGRPKPSAMKSDIAVALGLLPDRSAAIAAVTERLRARGIASAYSVACGIVSGIEE